MENERRVLGADHAGVTWAGERTWSDEGRLQKEVLTHRDGTRALALGGPLPLLVLRDRNYDWRVHFAEAIANIAGLVLCKRRFPTACDVMLGIQAVRAGLLDNRALQSVLPENVRWLKQLQVDEHLWELEYDKTGEVLEFVRPSDGLKFTRSGPLSDSGSKSYRKQSSGPAVILEWASHQPVEAFLRRADELCSLPPRVA